MARKNNGYQMPLLQNFIEKPLESVIHDSMMPYAEHVILERALPRVEDGLKPVQRRILYTMHELGLSPDKPHRKCARIVGDCMGKFHPHGDSSVYDALVRMAQDFIMRDALIDGQGNFGTVDGDSAAAMRYTEARMMPLALELLKDIDKDTVSWSFNFDDTLKEPDTLPGNYPNLLVNGASGIAVGLATNIPTHNLGEVIDAVIAQIDNPRITLDELMQYVKAPDFPTGGYLLKTEEIRNAYDTGRGKLTVRANVTIENAANGKKNLVINEIPYQVNKGKLLEGILKLREEKKGILTGIADIRDESDRNGMRAVVEIRKDADADKILQYLYKYSDLQVTFGVNMIVIADGKPAQMGLLDINRHYIKHQRDVVTRRTRYDLDAAKAREHILLGLIIAINNIDKVIKLIRSSKNVREARERLREAFNLSEKQAQAILDMRLQKLTNLEVITLEEELRQLQEKIKELESILASKRKLMEVIKSELKAIKKKYKTPRRTQLLEEGTPLSITHEDIKVVEDVVVTIDKNSMIKRIPQKNYSRSADFDIEAIRNNTEAIVTDITECKSNDNIFVFTDKGNFYQLSADSIPECRKRDKGTNLLRVFSGMEQNEAVVSLMTAAELFSCKNVVFVTRSGTVKATDAAEYNIKKSKAAAIKLKDGDTVLAVLCMQDGDSGLTIVSRKAMSLCIAPDDIPVTGRVTAGVKGMTLDNDDEAVFAAFTDGTGEIITISERGYAKRSFAFDYEPGSRARKGVKTFDFKKNGSNGTYLSSAMYVKEPYDIIIEMEKGDLNTANTEEIWIDDRFSQGKPLVMALLNNNIKAVMPVMTLKDKK